MSDLIRRSDAIEAIEGVDWYHQNSRNKDMVNGANSDEHQAWYKADDVYKALKEVPSADRPRGEVDAVKEYEHQVHNLDQGYITLGEFDKRIEPLRHLHYDRPQGWIPCSERLPEERQDVYVTVFWDDYGDTITAYGMRTQFGWLLWNTAEGELLKGYTVTAWMPLPKPYGERKESE